jgi:hypothetical protein
MLNASLYFCYKHFKSRFNCALDPLSVSMANCFQSRTESLPIMVGRDHSLMSILKRVALSAPMVVETWEWKEHLSGHVVKCLISSEINSRQHCLCDVLFGCVKQTSNVLQIF